MRTIIAITINHNAIRRKEQSIQVRRLVTWVSEVYKGCFIQVCMYAGRRGYEAGSDVDAGGEEEEETAKAKEDRGEDGQGKLLGNATALRCRLIPTASAQENVCYGSRTGRRSLTRRRSP